jgi:hypothetical protein
MKIREENIVTLAQNIVRRARRDGVCGVMFKNGLLTSGYSNDADCGLVVDDRDETKLLKLWSEPRNIYGPEYVSDKDATKALVGFLSDFANEGELEIT